MQYADQRECVGKAAACLLAVSCLIASAALVIRSAPSDLDLSFGNGGKVITQGVGGLPADIPAPADYDGDDRADAAVYRAGIWYLRQSTSGTSVQQFGLSGDKPMPSAFLP